MTRPRIIKNYTVARSEADDKSAEQFGSFPKVIVQPKVSKETKVVDPLQSLRETKKDPVLEVRQNEFGMITSIDVICVCGERFTIQMVYE